MKRTLIIGVLALGLFAMGCDDETDAGPTDASSDGGDARGSDGGDARGDGGTPDLAEVRPDAAFDAPDAAAPVDAVAETGSGGGGTIDTAQPADSAFAMCKSPTEMTGVTPADFCTYVMINCGFGAGAGKFLDTAACMARYNAYTAEQKSCAAYHACVAGTTAQNAILHCPHPVGVQNNNPCNLPL